MYKPSILGIDVGKSGSFCLLSHDGTRYRFWEMPLVGGKITPQGIAAVYQDIKSVCKTPPKVYCEKIYTKPGDGRVGMVNYALGAGYLAMVTLWDWSFTQVSPKTWCPVIHRGLSAAMEPKDRTIIYLQQKYPELIKPGSEIWPKRAKKPHLGHTDAMAIACYGRMQEYAKATIE